ncbi:hypothetical protein TSUD_267820 [Trifolium subterraneum]|uniref:Uncharacterized protein n=1 Tax=Trifolium subterraneum TaxID=3900 RepID=A0A2Z6PI90_TRISU|nr:hypothetical protein TSUD_267820 [Trifolium subterraneum]
MVGLGEGESEGTVGIEAGAVVEERKRTNATKTTKASIVADRELVYVTAKFAWRLLDRHKLMTPY